MAEPCPTLYGGSAVLYLNMSGESALHRRRLDGILRFARPLGWKVETLEWTKTNQRSVRRLIDEKTPVGCIMECWVASRALPPDFFGKVPVVYFDPPDAPAYRGATTVDCDNAAVAMAAFRELSSGLPPSYAVVSCFSRDVFGWARQRTEAFAECCRAAGHDCQVFSFPAQMQREQRLCAKRLAAWVSTLPRNCAVFAVNDWSARLVSSAFAQCGRNMPRDVTLVGADDASADPSGTSGSAISSVRIDFERSGYLAAKALAERTTQGAVYGPLFVERRESTRGRGRTDPYVMPALEIIRSEACDGLTAAALATRFPGSRKHFERRFREAMGHSILDEILLVRLQRVGELLAGTDMPISAIADFSGFRSHIALHKLFRSRTGMSMRDWRKKHRSKQ